MKHLAFWTQTSTPDESIKLIKELALLHAHKGGKQGEDIANLINSDRFSELCSYDLDYGTIESAECIHCRQALAFFKKSVYLPLGEDRRENARAKFLKAELECQRTNAIFELRDQGLFNFEPWVDAAIMRARQKIAKVLGDLPKIADLNFKFGPGATTLTKKSKASTAEKLEAGFSCSEDLVPYASRILEEMPEFVKLHEGESERIDPESLDSFVHVPVFVTPGRVNFVPKDARTERSVIVEGSLNVLVQGAIGRYMARRLKASGIDLSDQSLNQRLACEGSLTGALATLDLVSASDMMAIAIVKELLPWEWYFFLSTCRSSTVTMTDKSGAQVLIKQEKFSSMGNGFTFPLQSLIFWALARSAPDVDRTVNPWTTPQRVVSVYGDDIIVETDTAPRVMRLLEICGFEVNKTKSYWTGPFRESCGADFLKGINVRPWYNREVISPKDLFRLHNFYVRHGMMDMADLVKDRINPTLRIYGPDGYGDGHLLGDWLPKRHKRADSHGYGGVLFDTFKLKPRRDSRYGRKGDKVLPVYTIYVRENAESVLPLDKIDLVLKDIQAYVLITKLVRNGGSSIAVEPLPELRNRQSGETWKSLSLPGTDGYVRVSIYTFDTTL